MSVVKNFNAKIKVEQPVTINTEYSISYCIPIMNRLYQIEKTLPANLEVTKDSPNVNFVICNYGSTDGLDDYILENYSDELQSGKITYVHNEKAKYFHMAHAKNIAHVNATGEIVCNLDADTYITETTSRRINETLNREPDTIGQMCTTNGTYFLLKYNYDMLGGYDENFREWGGDDNDFRNRAIKAGLKNVILYEKSKRLFNTNKERTSNYYFNGLDRIHWINSYHYRVNNFFNITTVNDGGYGKEGLPVKKPVIPAPIYARKDEVIFYGIPGNDLYSIKKAMLKGYSEDAWELENNLYYTYPRQQLSLFDGWSFALVRNPYNRVLKLYYELVYSEVKWTLQPYNKFWKKMSFEQFILAIGSIPKEFRPDELRPQVDFIDNQVDKIIKYEEVNNDIKLSLENVEGSNTDVQLEPEYAPEFIAEKLTDTIKNNIYALYVEDFSRFNYDK